MNRSRVVVSKLTSALQATAPLVALLAGCADLRPQQSAERSVQDEDEGSPAPVLHTSAVVGEDDPPILAVGHGAALLPDGTWSERTPELVRKAQAFYLARLEAEGSPDTVRKLNERRTNALARLNRGGRDAELANGELIDFMIDEVQPADAVLLKHYNAFLVGDARSPGANTAVGTDPTPNANGVSGTVQNLSTTNTGTNYANECAANGVPNPPSWGSPSWVLRGNLTAPFISTSSNATVYTYTSSSPRGICIALPRSNPSNGNISLLGIICQGNDTSKSCFWDNTRVIGPSETFAIPSSTIIGGADLFGKAGNVCTDCHAGENAFIIHPRESALNLGDSVLRANGWVSPIVHNLWPQSKPGASLKRTAVPAGQSSCTSCHNKSAGKRIPSGIGLSGYCNTTAATALSYPDSRASMPPTNGSTVGSYTAHKNAITTMCRLTPNAATGFGTASVWHSYFAPGTEVPLLGDFNGDGRSDIITFTVDWRADAIVALSSGASFGTATVWHDYFGSSGDAFAVGDFNGDDKDDILVAGGTGPSHVALSNGSSFGAAQNWGGHVLSGETIVSGDFNNDRRDDLAIFTKGTAADVYVQLSTGTGFGPTTLWHGYFAPGSETPLVGDFNNDGRDDIVTFTGGSAGDVYVALSTGSGFGASQLWHSWFAPGTEVPRVADVNGDGRDDIVTFVRGSVGDVYVAMSTGAQFGNGQGAAFWHDWFGINNDVLYLGDVDGDERADAVGFNQGTGAAVWVAKTNAP